MSKHYTIFENQSAWESGVKDYPNVSMLNDGTVIYQPTKPRKALLLYTNEREYEVECDISSSLTRWDIISGYSFKDITEVEIGSCTNEISASTFVYCDKLESVTIPSGVTSIDSRAFCDCYKLSSVTFSEGSMLTSIGGDAFSGCRSLTSIDIPDSVTKIGNSAFYGCSVITSITIPSGVTSICNNAFYGCSGLTSITIPSGVTSIGDRAFYNCSGLASITINATTPPTVVSNSFSYTNFCPIYVPVSSVDAYKSASNWSTYASRIQAIPNS